MTQRGVNNLQYSTKMLVELEKQHLRVQYAKITLLSFQDEKPIRVIEGDITAGNLSVNASSRVRRTLSLTMLASIDNSGLENIDNEISINKKIKVEIGYKNYLKDYQEYGEILWFPCGIFVLSSASIQRGTNGWTISISGKDKMCLLDGTAGGTLPASTTFHESLVQLDSGDYEIQYPTIYQIIFEAVNHWGNEPAENIIITDIDDQIKMLVKYVGDEPIYFDTRYTNFSFNQDTEHSIQCSYGENAGYKYTDFTYPGELVLSAGNTVVTLLDKIVSTLGNYEYYYDLDGRFIFQEIKNYLNTSSPLLELDEENYVRSYDNAKYLYSLTSLDTTTAITVSPKYDNIKNDFYVWGTRTTAAGTDVAIRYHLAIDTKPMLELANQNMYEVRSTDTGKVLRYEYENNLSKLAANEKRNFLSSACEEWREELYRKALEAQITNSVYDNYYDSELIAEWRNLYNPDREEWSGGWNPAVKNNPETLNYWLDFIDTTSALGDYSVNNIGRRTKVINNDKVKTIYNKEVPDIIFLTPDEEEKINELKAYDQKWFQLTDQVYDYFSISSTGTSCYDQIREMMYQNLCYNTTITLTCLPKYYIEPNNIIHIEDKESNIYGNYQITQYSLPLTYNGTMSITATQVLTRV